MLTQHNPTRKDSEFHDLELKYLKILTSTIVRKQQQRNSCHEIYKSDPGSDDKTAELFLAILKDSF